MPRFEWASKVKPGSGPTELGLTTQLGQRPAQAEAAIRNFPQRILLRYNSSRRAAPPQSAKRIASQLWRNYEKKANNQARLRFAFKECNTLR